MKKIIPALLLLIVAMPFQVNAHTALTASSPKEGEVLTESPNELKLTFATVIEEGSSMTLSGPEAQVEISGISIEGNVMKGAISEEMTNGSYIISWKIIGEDGHPIDGEIPFSLEAAVEAEVEQPVQEEAATVPPVADASEKQASAEEQTEDEGVMTILLLIAITVLVGFGSVLLIKMKR